MSNFYDPYEDRWNRLGRDPDAPETKRRAYWDARRLYTETDWGTREPGWDEIALKTMVDCVTADPDIWIDPVKAEKDRIELHRRKRDRINLIKWLIKLAVVVMICTAAGYGLYALVSWIATPAPAMTMHQAWEDGYANGLTDLQDGSGWATYGCVYDWNGQGGYDPTMENGGFSNGGPPVTRGITFANQDTHSKLGNEWMNGCRAALRSNR